MITKIYKPLTYLLLLPAALLSIFTFFSILFAFVNPGILFISFLLASVVIYTICSLIFLQKVVVSLKEINAKLKDWIKVNAFVTVIFALMMFFNIFSILTKPLTLRKIIGEMVEQQKGNPNFYSNENVLYNVMISVFIVFAIYSGLLLIHIGCTFNLLKKHQDSFVNEV